VVEIDGVEHCEPPLGSQLQSVDVGEMFPRFLQEDGAIPVRHRTFSRIEIDDIRRDLEQMCASLDRAFKTGEFPAVPGSHCSECPMEPECPLPRNLRRFAGAINTEEQARESAEWWVMWTARLKATRTEIKNFCKTAGPLRFGKDLVFEFKESTRRETNHEGLQAAAMRAAQFGEPFDFNEHVRAKLGTDFRDRKLTAVELAAERQDDDDE
jgi:hypothetical protein